MALCPEDIFQSSWRDGVYQLTRTLSNPAWILRLSRVLNDEILHSLSRSSSKPARSFSSFGNDARFVFLGFMHWLLTDWPRRFVDVIHRAGCRRQIDSLARACPERWVRKELGRAEPQDTFPVLTFLEKHNVAVTGELFLAIWAAREAAIARIEQ